MLAGLAIGVNRLGYGLSSIKAFAARLVGFGSLIFFGAFAFKRVLGAFNEVVGGFLHGFGSFLHEAVVSYGVGSISGQVLYFISGG